MPLEHTELKQSWFGDDAMNKEVPFFFFLITNVNCLSGSLKRPSAYNHLCVKECKTIWQLKAKPRYSVMQKNQM